MPGECLFINGPWDGKAATYDGLLDAPPRVTVPQAEQPRVSLPRRRRRTTVGFDPGNYNAQMVLVEPTYHTIVPGYYQRERRPVEDGSGKWYARYFWRRGKRVTTSTSTVTTNGTSTFTLNWAPTLSTWAWAWTYNPIIASSSSSFVVISNV